MLIKVLFINGIEKEYFHTTDNSFGYLTNDIKESIEKGIPFTFGTYVINGGQVCSLEFVRLSKYDLKSYKEAEARIEREM